MNDTTAVECAHDWQEEYYGYRCLNCKDFIPFGCEPWMDYEPDESDFCPHCGKEYEDFSDMGCGYCDRRSPDWGIMP